MAAGGGSGEANAGDTVRKGRVLDCIVACGISIASLCRRSRHPGTAADCLRSRLSCRCVEREQSIALRNTTWHTIPQSGCKGYINTNTADPHHYHGLFWRPLEDSNLYYLKQLARAFYLAASSRAA